MACSNHSNGTPALQRRERLGLAPGDSDPALDELSDEEYVFREEPEELVAARARLAAYTGRPGEEEPPGGCTFTTQLLAFVAPALLPLLSGVPLR
jgi:hypothetical protein